MSLCLSLLLPMAQEDRCSLWRIPDLPQLRTAPQKWMEPMGYEVGEGCAGKIIRAADKPPSSAH